MKSITGLWVVCLSAALLIAGCDQMPGAKPGTLFVDLGVVSKAIGHEQVMQQKFQAAREELNAQLAEQARNLEQQIEEERDKLGEEPTQEQELELQQMLAQAQQQYRQFQTEAQQKMQQFDINLAMEFRDQVKPFAEKIARQRGSGVIQLLDQSVLWFDPTVNITEDVIASLREAGAVPEAAADQPVEVPAAEAPVTGD